MRVAGRKRTFFYGMVLFLVALFLVWISNGQVLISDKHYTSSELARQMVSVIDSEDNVEKVYNNLSKSKQMKEVDSAVFLQYTKILREMKGDYNGKTLFRILSDNEKEQMVDKDVDLRRDISDTDKFDIVELIFADKIENMQILPKAYFVMSVDSEGRSYLSGDWLEASINADIYADYYFKCLEEKKSNVILKLYELGLEDKVSNPNEVAAKRNDEISSFCRNIVEKRVGLSYSELENSSRENLVDLLNRKVNSSIDNRNNKNSRNDNLPKEELDKLSKEEIVDLITQKSINLFHKRNVKIKFVSKSFIRFTADLEETVTDVPNKQQRVINVKLIDDQCIVDDKFPDLFNISNEEKDELAILHFKDGTPGIKLGEDVSYSTLVEKFGDNLDVEINSISDDSGQPEQMITVILPGIVLKFSSDVVVEDLHNWSGRLVDIVLVAKNDYFIGHDKDENNKLKVKVGSKKSDIHANFPFYDGAENPLNFVTNDNISVRIDFKYFDNSVLSVHVSEFSDSVSDSGEVN